MIDVLVSTQKVFNNLKNVSIDRDKVVALVQGIKAEDLKMSDISLSKKTWSFESLAQITFIFNSINFCYWAKKGESKWTVAIEGEQLDGSIALFRCLKRD